MAELVAALRRVRPSGAAARWLPALLLSRVLEQAALGGMALLLAARLGTERFAPVAALFIVNSAAVTLSDYGVGLAVLRRAAGERLAVGARVRMRQVNVVLAIAGCGIGAVVGGTPGTVIAASGVVWWLAAEAFVNKASVINAGAGARAAHAEVAGAFVFAVPIVVLGTGSAAVAVTASALAAKHLVELVIARSDAAFTAGGDAPAWRSLWGTQIVAFGVANIDYLLVAVALGARAFSVYTIAFRIAAAIPSVVAYAATRTAVADISATDAGGRQRAYLGYVRPLFGFGVLSALVLAALAFVAPSVLGSQWDALRPTILVLAVAVPWRMVLGQAGALALAARRSRALVHWQVVQLVAFAVVLAIAVVAAGYGAFVGTVAVGWIVAVTLIERAASHAAQVPGWPRLVQISACAAALAAVIAGVGFG